MTKGLIIGTASVAIVILFCGAGGAVLASKIGNENENNIKEYTKTKLEEDKIETKIGWKQENGNWYFYKNNEKQIDWIKDNNVWYYLGNDGKMRTGWIKNKNQWYYLNGDGTMATNTTVDGCYLNNNGLIEETPIKTKQNNKSFEDNDDYKNNISYKTYTNERFGFSIDYPSNLIPGKPPGNHDGLEFKSSDGRIRLTVSGMHNALFRTINDFYNEELKYIKVKPSYAHLSNNSYTISWQENGMIVYTYSILGESSINSFSFSYPVSDKEHYNDVVSKIYNSFKTPGINDM